MADLSKTACQVTLPYKVMSRTGKSNVREITYGTKNRKTPFLVPQLERAHKIVLSKMTPEEAYVLTKTVIKTRTLTEYKHLIGTKAGDKLHKTFDKLNDPMTQATSLLKNPKDFTEDPKKITLLDVYRPGGSTALVLAGSYSGKTTMLVHAINNIMREKFFDIVVIFTQSINSSPLADIESDKVLITDKFFPTLVRLAYDINKATNNRYRFLFILDDVYDMRNKDEFRKMILAYRNSGISTIVVTQDSRIVPPSTRSSVHKIFFLGSRDGREKENAIEGWLRGFILERGLKGKDNWNAWFTTNTRMGKEGVDNGCYVVLDSVHGEMTVQERIKPKTFS